MHKHILIEINRTREIMGLKPLLVEQSSRKPEADDIIGLNPREEECPCLDDNGNPDGSTSPDCCKEWSKEKSDLWKMFKKGYGSDEIPSIATRYSQIPEFKEIVNEPLSVIIAKAKEILPTTKLTDEEMMDGKSSGTYASLNTDIAKMEKILNMSEEDFLQLPLLDRVMYARTKQERENATEKYKLKRLKDDERWQEHQKNIRIKNTESRDKEFEKTKKYLTKLMKAFKRKLDKQSLRRWNNKDSEYNDKGWVMSEEDKKELFQEFKDYFIKWKDINPKWVKKYNNKDIKLLKEFFSEINLTNVKGPDEIISLPPIETPETEPTTSCAMDYGIQFFGVGRSEFTPFVNNRCEIHQDLKDKIIEMTTELGKFLENNPGSEMTIPHYRILTSASRARNGGQAENWSFAKLSECRANSVEAFVNAAFQQIGVTLPTPTIDSLGYNKDGSSGPNPPSPFKMVIANSDNKIDRNEENRNEFGTPLPCKPTNGKFICPNYDKYKYCMLDLPIEITVPMEEPKEEPGEPGHEEDRKKVIETREWEIAFIPRKKHTRKFRRIPSIKWNKMSFKKDYFNKRPISKIVTDACPIFGKDKKMGGSRIVGIAGGPVIDQVVSNNMASYNVQ